MVTNYICCLFIYFSYNLWFVYLKDYQTNQGKVLTSDAALKFFGMENETNYLNEEQKKNYFIKLGANNPKTYLVLLRSGFFCGSEFFVDWSLITYSLEHSPNTQQIATNLLVIIFFPHESRTTDLILSMLVVKHDLKFEY
jgi:hypothetical protein